MLISLSNVSNVFHNGQFPIFNAAIFVTIPTAKVKSIPGFYTLAIVLINLLKDLVKGFIFWTQRGAKIPPYY